MASAGDPHDVEALLAAVLEQRPQARICAQGANVADLVWVRDAGLQELDEQTGRLVADAASRRKRIGNVHYAAYVQADRCLVMVGQTDHGAFVSTVPANEWGWIRPVA